MLEISRLTFSYDKKRIVLDDISFFAQKGQVLSVVGPNGTGKTTLLNCIVGALKPSSGCVYLDSQNLRDMASKKRAKHLAYVPQSTKHGLNMKVMDYILLGRSPYFQFSYGKSDRKIAEQIMEEVGVSKFAMRDIKGLSGGEMQKVSIARALVQEPDVLLLDEPTSALDIRNQIDVLSLLRQIACARNIAIVMSIHDLSLSLMFSDAAVMLSGARIIKKGPVSKVITEKSIAQVYGVDASVVEEKYIHLHG